ncbi:hypothetical protein [Desulfosporosinus metallidurans]|uniref:Uncharacterized protein n=1 Tax=Desulfosporosinus metallidurans TaxID=1888891 RepID=A0A1Q8QDV5_9FIRM|nr:hypothetical protein [Desulfosporosinus metallidurans]OLN25523.1 hypothetical protein DSOL_5298 [Desulfosporosinus metallidurans]
MKNNDYGNKITEEDLWRDELQIDSPDPDEYPSLYNISSAFIFQFQAVPKLVNSPEYVYVPERLYTSRQWTEIDVFISKWNISWESGQARHALFEKEVPEKLEWLKQFKDHNVYLIPKLRDRQYYAYLPIYHMLPPRILRYYGLPLLKGGNWPHSLRSPLIERNLPKDFDNRVSRAFATYIWPLLNSQSQISAYSSNDSIKLLAHNLDYWMPYVNIVIEKRLQQYGRVEYDNQKQERLIKGVQRQAPKDISICRPLMGGYIWEGEEDAWQVAKELVDMADNQGKLRSVIDAIKSNRVEDDFSLKWSYEREDFERKLYKKRSKFRVKFVELPDTLPVQGPETEVENDLFWEDFVALLDHKERQVIILIRNGATKVGEISRILGYANHSPVSKALKKIRTKLQDYEKKSQ